MDDIDREQRRLYRKLGYGWSPLRGTPAQVEWAEGWRETFILNLCCWLATKKVPLAPDDYAQRVQMLDRDYLAAMRRIDSAPWWLDHFKEARYPVTVYHDDGMRRFIREAAHEGRRLQNER